MSTETTRRPRGAALARQKAADVRRRRILVAFAVAAVLALVLGGLYALWRGAAPTSGDTPAQTSGGVYGTEQYPYQVGEPGAGEQAPGFTLESSTGEIVSLADYEGKNVLLYFQEGLMCQPCWDQITDLEQSEDELTAAGIDEVVSITVDPVDLITRKVNDAGYTTPVLSDPDLAVTHTYDAHKYGMMGDTRPGHSFILVDGDGTIRWRADYGGEPKYVMFLPTEQVITDMRRDLEGAGA